MTHDEPIEAAAELLSVHRWKSMGVASVECKCGEILYGDSSLTQFPADEAFRKHLAEAVSTVAVEAVLARLAEFLDTWDETRPTERISTTRLRMLVGAIRAEWGRSE